jgi:hypothetical protein
VDPGSFEPNYDFVHEQGELLSPARRRGVYRQLTAALGSRLGARRDPFTDDLPPLLAIDRSSSIARGRLA